MKYFIPQVEESDCGFACLKMMVATLYENENALYIKHDENHGPYSFKELKDKGGEYGISLDGIEVQNKRMIKDMRMPFIALIKKKNDLYHYVLVTEVKYGFVKFLDPSEGESVLSLKSFFLTWTGNSLIISDFEKNEDVDFQHYDQIKRRINVPAVIFQFLSAIFLVIAIFFIDEKTKIYIPILFFSLAFISEILLRLFLVKELEKMDESYLNRISVDKKKFYDFYLRLEEYKKESISSKMNVIFSFIVIIFITFVTLLNNIYNAFLILIPLFIVIIDTKIVETSIKEKDELINIDEKELANLKTVDQLKSQINKIHLRGYKLAKGMLLKRYIYLAIILLVALLTTVFNETFSLPYVVFYFAIGYMIYEQFDNFIKYPEKKKSLLKCKVRLYNLTNRI